MGRKMITRDSAKGVNTNKSSTKLNQNAVNNDENNEYTMQTNGARDSD